MAIPKRFRGSRYIRAYHCIGEVRRDGYTPAPKIGEPWRLSRPTEGRDAHTGKPWRARCCGHGLHASLRPSQAYISYGWAAKPGNAPKNRRFLTLVRCRYVGDVRRDKFAAKERTILARITFGKAARLMREAERLFKLPTATKTAAQYFDALVRAEFRNVRTKGGK